MARLFISFYLFIALSLVVLAAALDAAFYGDDNANYSDNWLMSMGNTYAQLSQQPQIDLLNLATQSNLVAQYIALDDIAWTTPLKETLLRRQPVLLHEQSGLRHLYILMNNQKVLQISIADPPQPSYLLYSSLFFLMLGIALALWLWPLWRDLSKLNKTARSLNDDGSMAMVKLASGSVISPIGESFNNLGRQVKQLLLKQKELTGAVAHEFRTPLSRLKFALATRPEANSAPWKAMNDDVIELEQLVQEMLDYSHMESTQPELNMEEIPLLSLIKERVNKLKTVHLKHVDVVISGEDITIVADGYLVERAIQNILTNASRFAEKQILIRISTDDEFVKISIEDDGIGIPKQDLTRIFEPFYRPDKGRDRKRGGAGLGLAIVNSIQHWHRGKCWVDNGESGGACFHLTYPHKRRS